MKMLGIKKSQKGQGLVEYALILTLVAVVVIGVLITLGPIVGEVFSKVNRVLGGTSSGAITSVSAARTGGGNGNDVVVTLTVSKSSSVTAFDSQSGQSKTTACRGSCTVTLTGVGASSGTVTVTAVEGGTASTGYPVKP